MTTAAHWNWPILQNVSLLREKQSCCLAARNLIVGLFLLRHRTISKPSIATGWSSEEKAGNFEEAGRLAEEVLGDLLRASLLYEKD